MKVLIDTNILVYAWDSGDPQKQSAAIEVLQKNRNQAYVSTQSLSEFSSVMIRKGVNLSWIRDTVDTYCKIMTVCTLGSKHVELALHAVEQYQMSYWDAQIWAVALSNRIPVIISEDGQTDQEIEGIKFQNLL